MKTLDFNGESKDITQTTNLSKPYVSERLLEGLTAIERESLMNFISTKKQCTPESKGEIKPLGGFKFLELPKSILIWNNEEFLFTKTVSSGCVTATEIETPKGKKLLIWS